MGAGRLTKDEVGDLQSHVARMLETRSALENAQGAFDQETRNFNSCMGELQYSQRDEKEDA